MEPKFKKGDEVLIRPFDEIDANDIGRIGVNETSCFSIPREHINRQSDVEEPYVVARIDEEYNTYIYRIRYASGTEPITYWWAQGMLCPYAPDPAIELPDADESEFFDFLFVGAGAQ